MINYEKIYNEVLKYSYGYSLGNIWQSVDISMKDMNEPYEIRKDIFFKILEKLMKEEHVKLASNGHFLQGTIGQQLQSIILTKNRGYIIIDTVTMTHTVPVTLVKTRLV
nr:hypothetical protein [Frischella perrara]